MWIYYRFTLSYRDIEDLLSERGIVVSYETIRQWCRKFGPRYAHRLRKRQGRFGDHWFLDEATVITVQGERLYLWRAVVQDHDVIDVLVQKRKNKHAAKRFFRKMLKHQGQTPCCMITDKLKSHAAAKREVMPSVSHCQDRYANNRAEDSHQPTRQQERQMRKFKSMGHAQRFLSVHSVIRNVFNTSRHLMRACHYRTFRAEAFGEWRQVMYAC